MGRLRNLLDKWISSEGYKTLPVEVEGLVVMLSQVENRVDVIAFEINEKSEEMTIRISSREKIPGNFIGNYCEYIARANCGLKIGCFKIDTDDGEIFMTHCSDFSGVSDADVSSLLDFHFSICVSTWRKYMRGTILLNKGEPPERVCLFIENFPL